MWYLLPNSDKWVSNLLVSNVILLLLFIVIGLIVNSNFDNAYTNRQNKLQDRADSVGLGNANRLANMTISASGRAMPWVYGFGKIKWL